MKPRNFVAKNAGINRASVHKDKHREPFDDYYDSLGYSYGNAHYAELLRCWEAALESQRIEADPDLEPDASNLEI